MDQNKKMNQKVVLASRPEGEPIDRNFRLEQVAVNQPGPNEVLLVTDYLSLDPYMRGRMNDAKSYAEPVAINEVMPGGTVCRVEVSNHPDYQVGDRVFTYGGWQSRFVSGVDDLIKLPPDMSQPSYALGVLGMPGFTAYMGLLDIGKPQPGETLVVAAATGAVGSVVGQIGKIKGCNVIGVAGGADKCRYAVEHFGFDQCLDHTAEDFATQLANACPKGIDIYYESVGGKVFDAVMPLLNTKARIPLCGLISRYNATGLPEGPDRLSQLMGLILIKRITVQGFIIFDDYGHLYNDFITDMTQWIQDGKIAYREHIIDGLENAPAGLIGLLKGQNFGKVVVRLNS